MDFNDINYRINTANKIRDEINEYWSQKRPNRQSVRISPSNLGEECAAATWYRWRWAIEPPKADGRMARYNSRGEDNENHIIEWLRATGWTIYDRDEKGEQIAITDFSGHMYGKCDSVGNHPIHTNGQNILIEYKYINYKRFSALTTKPLIEADFKYYCQIVLYMDYLGLPACMFFPASRNDEDLKPTIIPADPTQAKMLRDKAHTVMTSKLRPARIAESPAFFKCKICEFIDICHNDKPLVKSCRSCVHCIPIDNGKFHCNKWQATIPSKEAIKAGCDEWVPVK